MPRLWRVHTVTALCAVRSRIHAQVKWVKLDQTGSASSCGFFVLRLKDDLQRKEIQTKYRKANLAGEASKKGFPAIAKLKETSSRGTCGPLIRGFMARHSDAAS